MKVVDFVGFMGNQCRQVSAALRPALDIGFTQCQHIGVAEWCGFDCKMRFDTLDMDRQWRISIRVMVVVVLRENNFKNLDIKYLLAANLACSARIARERYAVLEGWSRKGGAI